MSDLIIQPGNYVNLELDDSEILSVPYNVYNMALRRDVNDIRNPQEINSNGASLVFTKNEWEKIQKLITKRDFLEVHRWEKRDRFKILKKRQRQRNILFLNEANATGRR